MHASLSYYIAELRFLELPNNIFHCLILFELLMVCFTTIPEYFHLLITLNLSPISLGYSFLNGG